MLIAVAHSKGGVGKTTIAFNLALALRANLLLDMDAHSSLAVINRVRGIEGHTPLRVERPDTMSDLMAHIDADHEDQLVIADCGGFDSDTNRAVISYADIVITPLNDDLIEEVGLRTFQDVLEQLTAAIGEPVEAHALITRVHPSKRNFDIDHVIDGLPNVHRLTQVIHNSGAYNKAVREGLGVIEHRPASKKERASAEKAGKQFVALAAEIKSKLQLAA